MGLQKSSTTGKADNNLSAELIHMEPDNASQSSFRIVP